MTFVRAATPSGYSVDKTSPLGRLTTYTVERDTSNAELRQVELPNGLSSTSRRTLAQVIASAAPDGTQTTSVLGPDPRFDMRSPVQSSGTTQLPSGLTRASSSTRSATLSNSLDPFSMTAWTETTTLNGRTSTLAYNRAARIETSTSPGGRTSTRHYDALANVDTCDDPIDDTWPDVLPPNMGGVSNCNEKRRQCHECCGQGYDSMFDECTEGCVAAWEICIAYASIGSANPRIEGYLCWGP